MERFTGTGSERSNGRNYAFDGLGRMHTGSMLFDGEKNTFVAQYDTGRIFGLLKILKQGPTDWKEEAVYCSRRID